MYYDAGLGLLGKDVSSGVLDTFPLSVRHDICKSVVSQLIIPGGSQHLTTVSHVDWMMEVLGQTFRQPMEEYDLMDQAISIYRVWLDGVLTGNATSRLHTPKPVLDNPVYFFTKVYKHFTLVFEPRADMTKKQVDLCLRIVMIMQRNGRQSSEHFTFDLWEVLLKCLLGVGHGLLSPPERPGDLADGLVKPLLRALIELWLHACGCCFPNPTMWANLRKMCSRWRHRISLVHQWNATCLCLTRRVLNLLYGPSEGTPSILVTGGGGRDGEATRKIGNVKINIPDDCVVQAWHRMLHLIGNPSHIKNAQIFLLAIEGISSVVDCFLSVGNDEDRAGKYESSKLAEELRQRSRPKAVATPNRPSGNALLHIFGEWLFESAYSQHSEGRSRALGLLCRVFSSKQLNDQFLPVYLARFYTSVTDGLNMDHLALTEIVMSSTSLFLLELEGSRVLVIPFVLALEKILAQQTKFVAPHSVEALRRASISVLVALFSMPNHFQRLEIKTCSRSHLERVAKRHNESRESRIPTQSQPRRTSSAMHSTASAGSPSYHRDVRRQNSFRNERTLSVGGEDLTHLHAHAHTHAHTHSMYNRKATAGATLGPEAQGEHTPLTRKHSYDPSERTRVALKSAMASNDSAPLLSSNTPGRSRSESNSTRPAMPNNDGSPLDTLTADMAMASGLAGPMRSGSLKGPSGALVKTLYDLKTRIKHLLVKAFESETDPVNTQMLLYSLTAFVCEEAPHSPSIAQQAVRSILRRLIRLDWRTDVTHAAFETLTWMVHARKLLELRSLDIIMCLCKYIMDQASQPPTRHNVELHSKIAGAYRCLQAWITADPNIITDRQTLNSVLEVIELGLTGTCRLTSNVPISRTAKLREPKPLSQRARLAADLLLDSLINHVGHLPSVNGPSSISSLVTEKSLLRDLAALNGMEYNESIFEHLAQHMRYFVLDDDRIVLFCDVPGSRAKTINEESSTAADSNPSVWVLVREVGGRFCFKTAIRYVSDNETSAAGLGEENGSLMAADSSTGSGVAQVADASPTVSSLALGVHAIPHAPAKEPSPPIGTTQSSTSEKEILYFKDTHKHPQLPYVEDYVATTSLPEANELVRAAVERERKVHARFDEAMQSESIRTPFSLHDHTAAIIRTVPALEPPPTDKYRGGSKFQMGRLFASHAGLFGLPNVRRLKSKKGGRRIIPLAVSRQLLTDLYDLDDIPMRETDQICVLHMPAKCSTPADLVRYREQEMSDNDAFVDFLLSMCWVVSLDTHRGWKGVHPDADVFPKVLYYSDTLSELVLDCPSLVHDIPVSQHRASRTSAKTNNAKTRSHWSLSHSGNHTPTHPTLTRRPLHTYTHTHTHTSSIVKGSSGANRGTVLSNNGRGGVASRTLSSPVPLRLADFVPDGDVPPATPRPRFEEESSLLGDADSRQPSKTTLGDRTTALSMPGSPVIRINDHSQSHSSPGRPIAPVITLDEARAQADSGDDTPTPIPAHNRRQKYSHKGAEMEKGTDAVTYNARHSKNTPTRLDNRNSPSDSDETSEELSRRSSETLTVFAETTTSVLRTGEDNIRRRPKSEGTPKLVGDVERPPALGSRYMSFDKLTSNDKEHMRQRLEDDSNSDPDADGKQRLSRNNSPTLGDGDVSIADIETTNHSIVRKCDQIANSFVVVVWLDNFDDYVFFPFKDNEKLRLYVHPLPSGLFRIKVESAVLEGPLFDGMIVSRSVLGPLMRQTALNALRRKRLNTEKTGSRREEDVARCAFCCGCFLERLKNKGLITCASRRLMISYTSMRLRIHYQNSTSNC